MSATLIVVGAVIGVVVLLTRRWAVVARAGAGRQRLPPKPPGRDAVAPGARDDLVASVDRPRQFVPCRWNWGRRGPSPRDRPLSSPGLGGRPDLQHLVPRDDDRYPVFAATVVPSSLRRYPRRSPRGSRAHPRRLGGHGLVLLPAHPGTGRSRSRARRAAHKGLPRHTARGRRFRPGGPRHERRFHWICRGAPPGGTDGLRCLRLCRPEIRCCNTFLVPHHRQVLGKSAQGALQDGCRRDGGPTPASALIHALRRWSPLAPSCLPGSTRPSPRPGRPLCSASRPR